MVLANSAVKLLCGQSENQEVRIGKYTWNYLAADDDDDDVH